MTHITNWAGPSKVQRFWESELDPGAVLDPLEYPDKGSMPLITMARFGDRRNAKGSLRTKDNILARSGQELDYDCTDGAPRPIEVILELLDQSGLNYYFHTSPSYDPAKPSLWRWRVLLPFAAEKAGTVAEMQAHASGCVAYMEQLLGLRFGQDSKRIDMSYFLGRVRGREYISRVRLDGGYIDQQDGLDQFIWATAEMESEALDEAAVRGRISSGENYHESLVSLAGKYIAAGLDRELTITALEAIMDKAGRRPGWEARYASIPRIVDWVISKEQQKERPRPEAQQEAPQQWETRWLEPDELVARPWIYGRYLLRGYVTLVSGRGGVSKSVWGLTAAASIATGIDLMGLAPDLGRARRVLVLNNEDDRNEMGLRLHAIAQHHRLDLSQLRQSLIPVSGYGNAIRVAALSAAGEVVRTSTVDKIVRLCERSQVEVIMFDPLVSLHSANENDNGAMEQVVSILKEIALRANVAVLLVHHTRKGANPSDPDDGARGASALVNAVRVHVGLSTMTEEQAGDYILMDPSERRRYVAVGLGKSNYALPSDQIRWVRLASVGLWVTDPEQDGLPALESVGVPEPADLLEAVGPGPEGLPLGDALLAIHADGRLINRWFGINDELAVLCEVLGVGSRRQVARLLDGVPEAGSPVMFEAEDGPKVYALRATGKVPGGKHNAYGYWVGDLPPEVGG